MSKTKKINILFSIIYYLFGIIGFYLWFILAILSVFIIYVFGGLNFIYKKQNIKLIKTKK